MGAVQTVFGSLKNYEKGRVETIDDDPKHYVFSNVFEVASKSKAYEKVCVAQNLKYVIECLRAEGNSPWFAAAHDEAALVMDGQVEVHYIKPNSAPVPETKEGTVRLSGDPQGQDMGWVKCGRGHMALLPKGAAYQFRSKSPSVVLIQTIRGDNTIARWAEICQR